MKKKQQGLHSTRSRHHHLFYVGSTQGVDYEYDRHFPEAYYELKNHRRKFAKMRRRRQKVFLL